MRNALDKPGPGPGIQIKIKVGPEQRVGRSGPIFILSLIPGWAGPVQRDVLMLRWPVVALILRKAETSNKLQHEPNSFAKRTGLVAKLGRP